MTQTPLPPSYPPPEPLDADERELARALRNLPAGSPSPELDARILGAARRAVHIARPHKRKNNWLIGLGTAASALLAMGLFVRMHVTEGTSGFPAPADTMTEPAAPTAMPSPEVQAAKEQAAPVATDAAAAPAAAARQVETAPGDLEKAKAAESATATTSAPVMQSAKAGIPPSQPLHPIAAKPNPNAFPASSTLGRLAQPSPPPPVVTESPAPQSAPMPASPPPAREEQDERKSDGFAAHDNEPAAAGAAVAADKDEPRLRDLKKTAPRGQATDATAPAPASDKARNLDRLDLSGSRSKPEDNAVSGKNEIGSFAKQATIDDDATLQAAQWIERIRARLKAGDTTGARASLRRFRASYPDIEIPDDLTMLLP